MLPLLPQYDLRCFNHNYQDSRFYFLENIKKLDNSLIFEQLAFQHSHSDPNDESIFCDVVFLNQGKSLSQDQQEIPNNVLVLISATHGVEGLTGSAIQADLLTSLAPTLKQRPDLAVIMIHALNPWGFAWLRRCDHQGIDINRNFIDFSQPLTQENNSVYALLQEEINQENHFQTTDVRKLSKEIDFNQFIEQLTLGQYHQQNGLFYGGEQASWSRQVLEQITSHPWIKDAKQISVIDLHTGLGAYGYGELINDHQPNSAGFDWAVKLYGHNSSSSLLGESCSAPKLGLVDYLWHNILQDRGCFVTLEYGTYAVEQLISSLVNEQIYHQQLTSSQKRDLNAKSVIELKQFFYPNEVSWQQQVLFRARQVINMAINGITS